MKRLYLVERYCSTFGQTDAGCHSAAGPERIVASAPCSWGDDSGQWAARKAEQVAFMMKAQLHLHFGRQEYVLPSGADTFADVVSLLENRQGVGAFVSPRYGPWSIRIAEEDVMTLAGPRVVLDRENLAYQRELLRRS